jgi:glycosyltransferase involved in cell wall biosynthesis
VDVLILQRRMPALRELTLLRRQARFLIYDFDDALFLRDSYAPEGLFCPRRAEKFRLTVRSVDLVVAGNHFLQEEASLWTEAHKVHVIPTCVPVHKYPLANHADGRAQLQLAWIGTASTLRGLELIRPALQQLGRCFPTLRFKIICDQFLQFAPLPLVRCPWSQATEAQELASADIGISWLPDDLWSQGKCGLKILQYMAAGLPVVANAVGLQRELVREGETGFLVRTPEEFVRAIEVLAANPELRQRLGREGRRHVERAFQVSLGGQRWLELLGQLAQPRTALPIGVH